MAAFFYNSILFLFRGLARFTALWDPKSREWLKGRKNWRERMKKDLPPGEKRIWIHAASLGEFEQGRPLLEELKKEFPEYKILLSFFSPSGYLKMKDYKSADYIFYLPLDSKKNAQDFLTIAAPQLAIFIKYEFWYHYYMTLKKRDIPVLLVSAAFRKSQPFFKWYGGMFRKMLSGNIALFVQDEGSRELLASIDVKENVFISGDTRYDRVADIAGSIKTIPLVEKFRGEKKLLIAGSTWPADERILLKCLEALPMDWKLVLAPHETGPRHIEQLQSMFPGKMILYSAASGADMSDKKILVIDNIGLLSSLYGYGEIAFIGGGFQSGGIHNTLEPAVFGLPLLFGPRYSKFVEAVTFVEKGFATPVRNATEAKEKLQELITENEKRKRLHGSIQAFMKTNIGATTKVMTYIREKHLI